MNRPVFTFQQALERGSATPCVARTLLQTSQLSQPFFIGEDKKQELLEVSRDVMMHLVACLDIVEEFRPLVGSGIEEIEAGVETQSDGKAASLPSVPRLRKRTEAYLQSAKQALRDTGRLFEVFLHQPFDHRYDRARKWAAAERGEDSRLHQLLTNDGPWIERLIRYRNAVEHPRDDRGPLTVRDFRLVGVDPSGEPLIAPPSLWQGNEDPLPLLDYLEITHENLLTFFEELLITLLSDLEHPFGPIFVEIPPQERDPSVPMRFAVRYTNLPPMGSPADEPDHRGSPESS